MQYLLFFVFFISSSVAYAQQNGTTLSVVKGASGFWNRVIEYDWSVQKSVNPLSIQLDKDASAQVGYSVMLTKTAKAPLDQFGATGRICVNNGGSVPTENLVITDNVQAKVGKGTFQTIASSPVDVSIHPVIAPGETFCYSYQSYFTPVLGASYRNEAKVTITNHSGFLPGGQNCAGPALCAFGPQDRVSFSLPASYALIYKDASATISDTFTALSGFEIDLSDEGPWNVTSAGELTFNANVTNVDAPCASSFQLHNAVKLIEADTLDERVSAADLGIATLDCLVDPPVVIGGCTYTQGYWKNHENLWPVTSLKLGNVVYTKDQLLAILDKPVGSGLSANGLISLAHQLIAAKLNTLKEDAAFGGLLINAIAQADALIGDLVVPPVGIGVLVPSEASALVGQLTAFNEGGDGFGNYDEDGILDTPPHCQ